MQPIPADRFLLEAAKLEDTPYLWSGKGDFLLGANGEQLPAPYPGVDCSGLVTLALQRAGGPDWRASWWTQRFWTDLQAVATPRPGDLVLYAPQNPRDGHEVEHVMICWGDGRVYGACHGDHTTTTEAIARSQKAKVTFQPSATYRPRLAGYRSMPLTHAA